MAAATAGPMLFRKVDWWQQVRCGTVVATAAAGPSVFEQGTTEEPSQRKIAVAENVQ